MENQCVNRAKDQDNASQLPVHIQLVSHLEYLEFLVGQLRLLFSIQSFKGQGELFHDSSIQIVCINEKPKCLLL